MRHKDNACLPKWKRIFDVFFSLFALAFSLPLMVVIGLSVKIEDGGRIFFFHDRVGCNGKRFKIIKFRTMNPNAEQELDILLKDPQIKEEWEKTFKLKNDPRITRIGKILRRTSLDELPQFFNVLKGDMSVVGPRPVTEEELKRYYGEKAKIYKSIKPGITGYWQVMKRSDVEDYKERVEMDEWYIKNFSFILDMKIILKTVAVMLSKKGAY